MCLLRCCNGSHGRREGREPQTPAAYSCRGWTSKIEGWLFPRLLSWACWPCPLCVHIPGVPAPTRTQSDWITAHPDGPIYI